MTAAQPSSSARIVATWAGHGQLTAAAGTGGSPWAETASRGPTPSRRGHPAGSRARIGTPVRTACSASTDVRTERRDAPSPRRRATSTSRASSAVVECSAVPTSVSTRAATTRSAAAARCAARKGPVDALLRHGGAVGHRADPLGLERGGGAGGDRAADPPRVGQRARGLPWLRAARDNVSTSASSAARAWLRGHVGADAADLRVHRRQTERELHAVADLEARARRPAVRRPRRARRRRGGTRAP